MAVSKTQSERPAIVALIDLANQLEADSNTHARNIATLTEGLADEVSDREAADTLLEGIKFGVTLDITVPANDSYSGSYVYPEPFDASAKCFAFLGFANVLSQATLSLTLIDSSYSGFSYSVSNTDTDPATVTVGYLAIAVLPLS